MKSFLMTALIYMAACTAANAPDAQESREGTRVEDLQSTSLQPSLTQAAEALGIAPRDLSFCITGADGHPKYCCNETPTEECCFFFSSGQTECTFKGGPPIQTP